MTLKKKMWQVKKSSKGTKMAVFETKLGFDDYVESLFDRRPKNEEVEDIRLGFSWKTFK